MTAVGTWDELLQGEEIQHGGTHGSSVSPLLHASLRTTDTWAALGQSPAPPSNCLSGADA
jgi:hypothetical protein